MKKLRSTKNKKKLKQTDLDQKEEVKAGKQYENFYNLVKQRLRSI